MEIAETANRLKKIPNPLNREVIKLCREGRTLEAVKLVHEKTGLGLKESLAYVDSLIKEHA